MIKVLMAGVEQRFEKSPRTLGELLHALRDRMAADGTVMTAVRFDGVDRPTFGDPAAWGAPLDSVRVVEVDVVPLRRLLLTSLDQAAASLGSILGAAGELAVAFREADVSVAQRNLGEFAQSLASLVLITSTVSQAASIDMARISRDGATAHDAISELSALSQALVAAQADGDWIALADMIEYEVSAALGRWPSLIDEVRRTVCEAISTAA